MRFEILFPELCGLYGDPMNAEYLRRCVPGSELVSTSVRTRPSFLDGSIDLVFLCSMTESAQTVVRDALRPYLDDIRKRISEGQAFLVTGNAMEVFFMSIQDTDGTSTPMLGLFDMYAKRDLMHRYNGLYLGRFGDTDIVGFKSQFCHAYGDGGPALFDTVRGAGRHPGDRAEGLRVNNFMATYLQGPLLITNPPFTKKLLELLGAGTPSLAYEQAAFDSYALRLSEFREADASEF